MKKFLSLLLVLVSMSFSASRTWTSAGSTDGALAGNYSGSGDILVTDTLLLDATSAVNWIPTADIECASINVTTGYLGSIVSAYKITTVGSQTYDGYLGDTLRISDTCKMTGNGKFRIGTDVWAKCTGATLKLLGAIDSIDLVQGVNPGYGTFGNWFVEARNTFKNIVVAQDIGSKCYMVKGIKLCYHSFTVGYGQVIGASTNTNAWGIDPDTSDFLFISYPPIKRKIFYSLSTFRAFYVINVSFPNITRLNWPKVDSGGSTLVQTNMRTDTLVLTDTMWAAQYYSGMIPVPSKFVTICRNNYNSFNGLFVYSNGILDTMEVHFGHSYSEVGAIGNHGNAGAVATGSFMLYLDTANIIYNYNWGSHLYGNTPMSWVADRGTVRFYPAVDFNRNDSIWSLDMPFYNVVCSTRAGLRSVIAVDSMTVNNRLHLKSGHFRANASIRVMGDFVDSTSDSTVLSSLYLGGNAYISSGTKLRWNTGAKIYAVGTTKQTIYTNGQTIPKVVVRKGSKLTVK